MHRPFRGVLRAGSLSLILLTVTKSAAQTPGSAASATPAKTAMLPAQLQATVYEVQTTPEQASSFDARALVAESETADTLLKALSEKGKARILYRIDQAVNAADERIEISAKEPVVTGSRRTATGQNISSVTYQNVGLIVQLSSREAVGEQSKGTPNVSLSVELATLTGGEKEAGPNVKMVTTRNVSISHSEPLQFDKTSVALSVSSASAQDQIAPMVYVIRYRLSAPAGK